MKIIVLLISVLVMLLLVGCGNEVDTISTRTQYPKNTKDLDLDFKKIENDFKTSENGLIYNDIAFYVCNYDKVPVLMLNIPNNINIDLIKSDSNYIYLTNNIKVTYSANTELIDFSNNKEIETLELLDTYYIDGRTVKIIKSTQENIYYALVLIGDEFVSIEINETKETVAIELLKELCGLLVF